MYIFQPLPSSRHLMLPLSNIILSQLRLRNPLRLRLWSLRPLEVSLNFTFLNFLFLVSRTIFSPLYFRGLKLIFPVWPFFRLAFLFLNFWFGGFFEECWALIYSHVFSSHSPVPSLSTTPTSLNSGFGIHCDSGFGHFCRWKLVYILVFWTF